MKKKKRFRQCLLIHLNMLTDTVNLMGQCKKDVTPLPTHWSYVFLALTHRLDYASLQHGEGSNQRQDLTRWKSFAGDFTTAWTMIQTAWLCITHWGRVTHICVSKLTITGSDNGLSPDGRQAIIWTTAGILLIGPSGTNFSEIIIEIHTFSFMKMHLKISSGKWRPFCHGLNVKMFTSQQDGWPTIWPLLYG